MRWTITGWHVTFTFWHGASYAKSDKEDRNQGTMGGSSDGRLITVAWKTEASGDKYNGTFTAVRVGSGGGGPDPAGDPAPEPQGQTAQDASLGVVAGAGAAIQAVADAIAAADQIALDTDEAAAAALASDDASPSPLQAALDKAVAAENAAAASDQTAADRLGAIQLIVKQGVVAHQGLVQDAKDLATQVASVETGYQKAVAADLHQL